MLMDKYIDEAENTVGRSRESNHLGRGVVDAIQCIVKT